MKTLSWRLCLENLSLSDHHLLMFTRVYVMLLQRCDGEHWSVYSVLTLFSILLPTHTLSVNSQHNTPLVALLHLEERRNFCKVKEERLSCNVKYVNLSINHMQIHLGENIRIQTNYLKIMRVLRFLDWLIYIMHEVNWKF